jgi:hypothetical protein
MVSNLKDFKVWLAVRLGPSEKLVGGLITKVDELQRRLQQMAAGLRKDQIDRLQIIKAKFDQVHETIFDKDNKLDPDAWNAKPIPERREIVATLDELFNSLKCLNEDELSVGRRYFVAFFIILFLLSVVYLYLHTPNRPEQVKPVSIIEASKQLRTIESEIRPLAKIKAENGTPAPGDLLRAAEAVRNFRKSMESLDISVSSLQLLGTLEAEVDKGEVKEEFTETGTFTKLSKLVPAELETLRSPFLWNDRKGRWKEIAWWAELGTLVGILFYIGGNLSAGRFEAAEIAEFWTQAIIAPIVVLAIFFLFTLTGITGISPGETSITGNVGFAFIFGFAIRRTIGLLDTIKKRIFPDPDQTS